MNKKTKNWRSVWIGSIFIFALVILSFLTSAPEVQAATCTATAGGNWNTAGTWTDCGHVPLSTDDVVVNDGFTVTVDTAAECASISFQNTGGGSADITISGSNSLTVSGATTIPDPSVDSTYAINVNAGIFSTGTLVLQALANASRLAQVNISTGTASVTGATFSTGGTSSQLIFSGAGTLNTAGTFMSGTAGTFTPSTGTINFNAAGAQSIAPFTYTFNNVTLSNSGAKTLTNATINGTLSIQGTVTTAGSVTYGAVATLEYKGSAAQTTSTVEFPASWTGSGGVKINNANGVTLDAAKNLNTDPLTIGDTVSSSILDDGGYQITSTGTLNLTSGTLKLGSAGTATTWPAFSINNITAGTTVEYVAGVAQAVSGTPSYQNLTFSGAGDKTTAAAITVGGNWDTSGGTADLNTNTTSITVTGDLTGTGAITSGTGTISLAGNCTNNGTFTDGGGTFIYSTLTGGQTVCGYTYNNLTFSNTSGTDTAGGALVVNGALTTTAGGTLDMTANYTLGGSLSTITNNGTIKTSVPTATSATPIPSSKTWGGTIEYGATAGLQTVVAGSYNDIIFDNSSGTNTAGGNITANGTLTTTAGGTLDMTGAYTLGGTLATITNNGIIKTSVPTIISATPISTGKTWGGTGTIEYAGTTAQTVVQGTYNDLTLSGAGAKTTESGTITVGGNWDTSGGTADLDTNDTNINITGNLTGSGAITNGLGTISLSGNCTNNGNYTDSAGTFTYSTLTGGQTVCGYNTASYYNNLTFSNTSGTNAAGGALDVNGTLTTTAGGTLDMSTFALGGTLSAVANGGTIKTQNTSGAPIPGDKTWGGAVEFNGAASQTISGTGSTSFNDLILNNASGAVIGGNTTVSNTLTLTSGVLATGSNAIIISSDNAISGAGAGNYVNGNLQMHVATGGTSKAFEIGDASNYTPVSVAFNNVSSASYLTISTTSGDCTNIASSSIHPSKSVNRCWSATDAGLAFDYYSAVFNFINPGDLDVLANTANFIVGKYSSGAWSYPTVGTKNASNTQITGETSFSDFELGELDIAPVAIVPSSISQYTDGSGYVTFQTTISDADSDETRLKIEYSDDGGTNWYDPDLVSVTPDNGSVDMNDANAYQIGTTDGIDTDDFANITLTIVWDTQSASNGSGSLDDIDQSDVQIRVIPNDSILDGATQTSGSFQVDNLDPTVANVAVDDTLITDADNGNQVTVTVDFSEAMEDDGSANPTLTFNADIVGSGTLTFNSDGWTDTDTYWAIYDIADQQETWADVDITVSGAQDAVGNDQQVHAGAADLLDVDMTNPTVTNVSVDDDLITEEDEDDDFAVTIDFSEAMNGGVNPTIAFDPAVATTLTDCSGVWTDANTYIYTCDIEDKDIKLSNIDINVSGARDAVGNIMPADTTTGDDKFDIDTEEPNHVKNLRAVYKPTSNVVELTWENPGSEDIQKIYIYRGTSRDFKLDSDSRINKNDEDDEDYTDRDITRGKTYYYTVVVRDEAGNKSDEKTVKIIIPVKTTSAYVPIYGTIETMPVKEISTESTGEGTGILPGEIVAKEETEKEKEGIYKFPTQESQETASMELQEEEESFIQKWRYWILATIIVVPLIGIGWWLLAKK